MDNERKEIIIREPSEKITPNFLNKFEVSKVLSILAQQIADNRPIDEDILEELREKNIDITAENVARKELEYGITNLIIYREVGDNTVEEWYVDEMEYYET